MDVILHKKLLRRALEHCCFNLFLNFFEILYEMRAKMKIFTLLLTIFILTFSACSLEKKRDELTISTNSWIGYAPLFYAKERGYLDKLNIKLILNVSLGESADIYSVGKADLISATQHEYFALKKSEHGIVPIILFDRSNGGDMIFSNKTVNELKKEKQIYAYLEIDSINAEILTDFLSKYGLNQKKIKFIDKDQSQIEDLKPAKTQAMLIATYVPYNIMLKKNGFEELASTRNLDTIIVVDALYVSKKILNREKNRLQKLKGIIDKSIAEIKKNKKASYKLVNKYLGNISFSDYLASLKLIQWANKPSDIFLERIKPMGYDKKYLIK